MDKTGAPFPPGEPPGGLTVMMVINELSKLFHDRVRTECDKNGIPSGYRHVLFYLAREDGISQLELVKRTHLKAPTISVSLQKMESEGLVIRKPDDNDQRMIRLYLTEKGKKLDELIRDKLKEMGIILEDTPQGVKVKKERN